MSVPESTAATRTPTESLPVPTALRRVASLAAWSVRFVAFWVATLLPFLYLPLLAMGVITTNGLAFAGVVGFNAVAFVVGHAHNSPE